MPWKESHIVDQRLQFLSSYQKEGMSLSDLCREFAVSANSGRVRLSKRFPNTASEQQRRHQLAQGQDLHKPSLSFEDLGFEEMDEDFFRSTSATSSWANLTLLS
jgi:hypothetical protein